MRIILTFLTSISRPKHIMDEIVLAAMCFLFYLVIKLTDSRPNKVQYYIKWYSYYLYGLFVCSIISFVLVWKGKDIRNLPLAMKWLQPMTRFHGMTWHLENAEVMDTCGRAVIISNHQSSLDLLGLFHAASAVKMWIPTAKKELFYMGPIGLLSYLIGTVFINRRHPKDAYTKLHSAVEIMAKNEAKIWMYPEGTRNIKKKVKLLPFKRGAFMVAVAAQAPIIPVVYSPYYFLREEKHIFENGGHVMMRCLAPVPTAGLTADDVPALAERLHTIVLNAYEELSKEVLYRFPGAARSVTAGE